MKGPSSYNAYEAWKRGGRQNPDKLARFVTKIDKYDREDYDKVLGEMRDFAIAREQLVQGAAGDLGYDVWQDAYSSFWKVNPELVPNSAIRPSHIVNKAVMAEAFELPDFVELRNWTQGDEIGSALAVNSIEPAMEELYKHVEEQIQQAQGMDQALSALANAEAEAKDLEEMFQDWTDQGGDPDSEEGTDWSQKMQEAQDRVNQLDQAAQDQSKQLEQSLQQAQPGIKQAMKKAMAAANAEAENSQTMADAWGLEPGALQKMPPEKRMELAKKMRTPRFQRIAELFGPMKRLAFSEQRRKVNFAPEEIYDTELGNDLEKVLLSELMNLRHPLLRLIFKKNYLEGSLTQYKMRGYEKVGKGGIIFCEDGSGSMSGEREIWAKAVGLCLLHIAKKQKRPFYAIHFGGRNELYCMDFSNNSPETAITPDRVIEFAELFFGGGTDFMGPMKKSLELLEAEHETTGAIKADIVFATDGMCGVDETFMQLFEERRTKLGFKLWGINIGGNVKDLPLARMAEGRVASINSLVNGNNVRDIFGAV